MIPDEAVQAAAKALYGGSEIWGRPEYQEAMRTDARRALEAATPHLMAQATKLISELADPDECWFDHHGGCQAHGYLDLKQGETCPQAEAKEWVRKYAV